MDLADHNRIGRRLIGDLRALSNMVDAQGRIKPPPDRCESVCIRMRGQSEIVSWVFCCDLRIRATNHLAQFASRVCRIWRRGGFVRSCKNKMPGFVDIEEVRVLVALQVRHRDLVGAFITIGVERNRDVPIGQIKGFCR